MDLGRTVLDSMKLEYDKSQVFEVAVISTMSSGKSTLINAFIGDELLPSRNQACTARTAAILDNDNTQCVTGHILFSEGTYKKIPECTAEQIAQCLESGKDKLADIIIECNIPGIRNIVQSLLIVDTPGTNNNADHSHKKITLEFLRTMAQGMVVYIINAAQMETEDDKILLEEIREILEKKPDIDILFVLNKADEFDLEKESMEQIMANCSAYLFDIGFSKINIFPVSSIAGLLIRKVLTGKKMTIKEKNDFYRFYDQFSSYGIQLPFYAIRSETPRAEEMYTVGKRKYLRRELLAVLENTGITEIEKAIEDRIIKQIRCKAPKVRSPSALEKG